MWARKTTACICVFCELNCKTGPDRHPLPRIQNLLDSLGGNFWFSILNQGSAYHQGFVSEKSRHPTSFSMNWGLYEYHSDWWMHQLHSRDVWRECWKALEMTAMCHSWMMSCATPRHLMKMGTILDECFAKCANMALSFALPNANFLRKKSSILGDWCQVKGSILTQGIWKQ